MDGQVEAIYCIICDILKALNYQEHKQREMTDAEVITTAIIAMINYGGNFEKARIYVKEKNYIKKMLSKSRFNRRLHAVSGLLQKVFAVLGEAWKSLNESSIYIIDSFPIAVCDNIRIAHSQIYQSEDYRGYQASKRRYFYGLKIHLMITADGKPVEFFLSPGGYADVDSLKDYSFDLPPGSTVLGDKAYNDYVIEDELHIAGINLMPLRKKNSKRPNSPCRNYIIHQFRKYIETSGSLISQMLPKSIHAVTARGFELKVALFVISLSINSAL